MSELPSPSRRAALWRHLAGLILAGGCVALGAGLEVRRLPSTFVDGQWVLPDADDYMRLCRARMILEGRVRVVRHINDLNPPDGATLHWTAPLDYLLCAGAKLVGLFHGGAAESLVPVGAWMPVLLGGAYIAVMITTVRRGCGWGPALLAGFMVAASRGYHIIFKLGHADHHALIELLNLLAVSGWITRTEPDAAAREPSRRMVVFSGICTALAMWVSAQSVIIWGAILVGATFATFQASPDRRPNWIALRFRWNVAVAIVVLIGMLVENWPRPFQPTIDSISVFHLWLAGLAFLLPSGRCATAQRMERRWAALLACAAAFIGWFAWNRSEMFAVFDRPEFYRWSAEVTELQPLYLRTATDWSIGPFINFLGYVPFALPLLVAFFLISKAVHGAAKTTLSILAIGVTILSFLQLRWLHHVNVGLVPVTVIGLFELARRIMRPATTRMNLMRGSAVAATWVILVWPSARFVLFEPLAPPAQFIRRTVMAAQAIERAESQRQGPPGPRRAIMSSPDEGPILLFHTRLPIVAGAYHRALDGYIDASRFFAERDPLAARRLLDRHGVAYIVTPSDATFSLRVFERVLYGEFRSFEPPQQKLEGGELFESVSPRPEITQTVVAQLISNQPSPALGVTSLAKMQQKNVTGQVETVGLLYAVSDAPPASASPPVP